MKKRTAWIVSILMAGAAILGPEASAQMPGMPPGYGAMPAGPAYGPPTGPGMAGPYGPGMPPGMMGPNPGMMGPGPGMMGPGMANPYAPPGYGAAPAGYMHPGAGPMPGEPGAMHLSGPAQGYGEGGYGEDCNTCGPSHLGFLRRLLPYDDGGCCAPHWFDAHVEFVSLRREDVSRTVNFMSDSPLGPIVLSTDDLDFSAEPGFRATVTRQVGPGSNIEFSYLGQHEWSSGASVASATNSLFSVFSGFGTFPVPGQGFTETDQAAFASIDYASRIDSFELNFRQRVQGYGCKVQGSWLAGVRYFSLDEDFRLFTDAPINNASATYDVGTYNGLIGGQGGGDIWVCLIPGLSIGAEAKGGLYLNSAKQTTVINGTTLLAPLVEQVEDDELALMGEASLMALWRVNQSWSVRGGYTFIWVDSVALAPENFNSTPPFLVPAYTNPPRVATIDTEGDILLHGFTIGVEYMW